MSGPQTASNQEFGRHAHGQGPDMLEAKLWGNPCPFAFRLNYLALLYNTPLYGWIQETYRLKRHEYVVLYSLALADGGSARDISETSGFAPNTLSRAIGRLEQMGLIEARSKTPGGRRRQALWLSKEGWALYHRTCPAFEAQEQRMLEPLSDGERQMLFELMSKVVKGAADWASDPRSDAVKDTRKHRKGASQ